LSERFEKEEKKACDSNEAASRLSTDTVSAAHTNRQYKQPPSAKLHPKREKIHPKKVKKYGFFYQNYFLVPCC
jgi:hypothetical protein